MRALLDTCVLSELVRPKSNASVRKAVEGLAEEESFVSVMSLGEIERGISLLDEGARKRALSGWLDGLQRDYAGRILEIDAETARLWGALTARASKAGRQVGAADGLIAATALRHGLHIMTRNVKDFEPTGAMIVNPCDVAG